MSRDGFPVVSPDDQVLVTGASGFLGAKVVERLLESGFESVRCFTRPSSDVARLTSIADRFPGSKTAIVQGNLQDRADCERAVEGVAGVVHCASGMRGSLVSMFVDSVITSRNLLDAILGAASDIQRVVHVSSFAIYETMGLKRGDPVTEETPVETHHGERKDPYGYVKLKQEKVFRQYAHRTRLPLVIVRPGVVFGPGGVEMSHRVGRNLPGVYLHLGGSNQIPLTFVDNCAEAIMLALRQPGIEGETFNVHDDDLPTAREFLRRYKLAKGGVRSVSLPYPLTVVLSHAALRAAHLSRGQLPVLFTPYSAASVWRGTTFDNSKAKDVLGWKPRIAMAQALDEHFADIERSSGRERGAARGDRRLWPVR
jgi:nucleoside-diphosphate-sugar epimerase